MVTLFVGVQFSYLLGVVFEDAPFEVQEKVDGESAAQRVEAG